MIKTIDGAAFSRMMLSAAAEIDLNKQKVNELNVFPVPDGDTGTNMSMTLSAASTELRKADGITLTKAADKTASALLRGARGNSGVILSLLFRGFSKSLKGKLEADGKDFAAALTAGVEAAYKAVMKPAEGTILTVSRLTADAARDLAVENNEIEYVLQHCLDTAHAALDNTSTRIRFSKRPASSTRAAWASASFCAGCSKACAATTSSARIPAR